LADQPTLIFSPQMDTDETQMGRLHVAPDVEVGFAHKEITAAPLVLPSKFINILDSAF
jgi:hypothetical protein